MRPVSLPTSVVSAKLTSFAVPVLVVLLLSLTSSAAVASDSVPGTLSDLSWMTGSWEGPTGGGGVIEENWIEAKDGSLAALVRMSGNGATQMIELIVIEEEEGSLVLRLEQWDAGFKSRSNGPATMKLMSIDGQKVMFERVGEEGSLETLGYSRPADDQFKIHVKTVTGAEFEMSLQAK